MTLLDFGGKHRVRDVEPKLRFIWAYHPHAANFRIQTHKIERIWRIVSRQPLAVGDVVEFCVDETGWRTGDRMGINLDDNVAAWQSWHDNGTIKRILCAEGRP